MTKNKLTLEEVKQKKEHIEKLILTMLQDFEYETNLNIVNINFSKENIIDNVEIYCKL